jgi:hypothetical protein
MLVTRLIDYVVFDAICAAEGCGVWNNELDTSTSWYGSIVSCFVRSSEISASVRGRKVLSGSLSVSFWRKALYRERS